MKLPPTIYAIIRKVQDPDRELRQVAAIIRAESAPLALAKLRAELPHIRMGPHEVFEVVPVETCTKKEIKLLRVLDRIAFESNMPRYIAA